MLHVNVRKEQILLTKNIRCSMFYSSFNYKLFDVCHVVHPLLLIHCKAILLCPLSTSPACCKTMRKWSASQLWCSLYNFSLDKINGAIFCAATLMCFISGRPMT